MMKSIGVQQEYACMHACNNKECAKGSRNMNRALIQLCGSRLDENSRHSWEKKQDKRTENALWKNIREEPCDWLVGCGSDYRASESCCCCSRMACCFCWNSLSQLLTLRMMSSMHPVDPKKTRGASDLRRIPTGIEIRAAPTENIHELPTQATNQSTEPRNKLQGAVRRKQTDRQRDRKINRLFLQQVEILGI